MASFEITVGNTFKAEGGYQNDPHDSANYVNGTLIGTNRGISAVAYYTYYKKVPTVADMKALTVDHAKLIFKSLYWDKVAGDFITNQTVAALMFQYVIGAGSSQLSDIKDIANNTFGKAVLTSNDLALTKADASFINGLNQASFHANLKSWRFMYFDLVVKRSIAKWELENKRKITDTEALTQTKAKFLKGWRNRLNTHIFKP